MRLAFRILEAIGTFIETLVTRKCWECNGTGRAETNLERCENCRGLGRL